MDKIELNDITLKQVSSPETDGVMDYAQDQISPGKTVVLNFELALNENQIIDSNFSKAPVEFSVGDGNLMPGFEMALFGLRADEEKSMTIPADQAFGNAREENIQTFPRYRFPADLAMEKGLMINFSDAGGSEQPGIIKSFDSERVEIDFNHPLADRDILFKVKIHSVAPVSS
jgi:FKBP-type peptidyl-prolyl cis-trans isomerase SlpA